MENQLGYFCKVCGRTDYVHEHEWVSQFKCYDCRKSKVKDTRKEVLDRKNWGEVCEMHKSGDYTNAQIAFKFNVWIHVVIAILNKYYGIGEQPVLMTFNPREELVNDFKIGDRVRIKEHQRTDTITQIGYSAKSQFKYRLKHSPSWFLSSRLEAVRQLHES